MHETYNQRVCRLVHSMPEIYHTYQKDTIRSLFSNYKKGAKIPLIVKEAFDKIVAEPEEPICDIKGSVVLLEKEAEKEGGFSNS